MDPETPLPIGTDGDRLQITPGDADVLLEIYENDDVGGGGYVACDELNDSDLQYPTWSAPED